MGIDFCNETERLNYLQLFSTARDLDIKPLYTYLCPVIIIVCFFSIIFNAILMSISRQSKVINKSPILLLSLNLAVTDLIASLLNGLGILFNSYLPEVHNIKMGQCSMLMFEVVRCAALVASALHLLALAFVHYRGIVNPLHYRSTIFFSQHLSRTINIISIACWIIPLTIMLGWFSSSPCQGFQSVECDYLFLLGFTYRYMVLTLFALPLLLMSAIYLRIFVIISRHQKGRRQNHERSTLSRGVLTATAPIGSAAAVYLPELIAASNANRCPACIARALQDDDDFTVSVVGEETVEEAVDEDTICRCTDDMDDDGYEDIKLEDDRQQLKSNIEENCSSGQLSLDQASPGSSSSRRLLTNFHQMRCKESSLQVDAPKIAIREITIAGGGVGSGEGDDGNNVSNNNGCIKNNADNINLLSDSIPQFKIFEDTLPRQSIVRVADFSSGSNSCANQHTIEAINSSNSTATILYNACDIGNGKNAVSAAMENTLANMPIATASKKTTTTVKATNLVINESPEQRGVELILIKAKPTGDEADLSYDQDDNNNNNNNRRGSSDKESIGLISRSAVCESAQHASSGFETGTSKLPPTAKLRKQLDKSSADPREAEQSVRVESPKTVSLLNSQELCQETVLKRDLVLEPKRTASNKSNVSRSRVAVRAQVSLGSASIVGQSGNGTASAQVTASELRMLTLPESGVSRCQSIGRQQQNQRHKCKLHRSGQLSLDQQSSQPLAFEAKQRSNLISRECTCDNKLDKSKLSRANTIASDSSRANTFRGTTKSATNVEKTMATQSNNNASQRSSISSALTSANPIKVGPCGATSGEGSSRRYRFGSSGGSSRRKARSHTSGSGGTGSQLVHCSDNRSIAVSNSFAMTNSPTYEPQRRHMHASAVPQTNTKALVTTLLILGTYFISYVPAIIFQVLTCIDDCRFCPYPLYTISFSRRLLFGAITTLLLIAKSIIDPFIYSYRMNEIQVAIGRYLSKRRSRTSLAPTSMHASQRHNNNNNNQNNTNSNQQQQQHSSFRHYYRYQHNSNNNNNNLNTSNTTQGHSSFKILNSSTDKGSLKSAINQSSNSKSSESHKQLQRPSQVKSNCNSSEAYLIREDKKDLALKSYNRSHAQEAHELLELMKNEDVHKIQTTSEKCAKTTSRDETSRIKFSLSKESKLADACDPHNQSQGELIEGKSIKDARCNGFRAFTLETPDIAKSFELIL